MKLIPFFIGLLLLAACNNPAPSTVPAMSDTATVSTSIRSAKDSSLRIGEEIEPVITEDTLAIINQVSNQSLALTSNALQLVNKQTGSTREIAFGMPIDELTDIVNNVLQSKYSNIGINTECGAGPLKIVSWTNGLALVFKEKKLKPGEPATDWLFEGWYATAAKGPAAAPATMAGIGVGSTRAAMEDAYTIKVSKTSLGQEFSTNGGLFGLFDGAGKTARITHLWSGTSCNFR
jgi:hypothetical protein